MAVNITHTSIEYQNFAEHGPELLLDIMFFNEDVPDYIKEYIYYSQQEIKNHPLLLLD